MQGNFRSLMHDSIDEFLSILAYPFIVDQLKKISEPEYEVNDPILSWKSYKNIWVRNEAPYKTYEK